MSSSKSPAPEIRRREARLSLFKDKRNLSWQHTETSWHSKCPNVHDSQSGAVCSDPSFYVPPAPRTQTYARGYTPSFSAHVLSSDNDENSSLPKQFPSTCVNVDSNERFFKCFFLNLSTVVGNMYVDYWETREKKKEKEKKNSGFIM